MVFKKIPSQEWVLRKNFHYLEAIIFITHCIVQLSELI